MNWTHKSNKWYDNLKEPWRFLLGMLLANIGIVLLCASHNAPLSCIGAIWILFLVLWRINLI